MLLANDKLRKSFNDKSTILKCLSNIFIDDVANDDIQYWTKIFGPAPSLSNLTKSTGWNENLFIL